MELERGLCFDEKIQDKKSGKSKRWFLPAYGEQIKILGGSGGVELVWGTCDSYTCPESWESVK